MFIQSYRTEPGGGGGNPWLPDPELLFDHTQYIHVAEVMLQIKHISRTCLTDMVQRM